MLAPRIKGAGDDFMRYRPADDPIAEDVRNVYKKQRNCGLMGDVGHFGGRSHLVNLWVTRDLCITSDFPVLFSCSRFQIHKYVQ